MMNIKHIFYSHSWVTQIVIESFIQYEEIPISDVLILSNRNFRESIDPHLKNSFRNNRKFLIRNFLHFIFLRNKLVRYQNWAESIIEGKEFILYAPHFFPIELKILLNQKKCKGAYLIEEGELSYQPKNFVNKKFNRNYNKLIHKFLMPETLNRAFLIQTIDERKLKGTIQIFEHAFPYSSNKIILQREMKKLLDKKEWNLKEYQNVLVLSPFVDVLEMNIDTYLERFAKAAEYINNSNRETIYFKFHPSDTHRVRDRTLEVLTRFGDKYKMIGDDVSPEAILLANRPKVYSFVSSISLYAFMLNCKLEILSDFITPGLSNFQHVELTSLEPYYVKANFNG